jgi:phage/conjugal plasmid C-4 type zinc finger TraR family protein
MDAGDRGRLVSEQYLKAALARVRSDQPKGDSRMICIDCNKPIPEGRRQAMPGCLRCLFCQQKYERHAV